VDASVCLRLAGSQHVAGVDEVRLPPGVSMSAACKLAQSA
jgi:hypothetical protein